MTDVSIYRNTSNKPFDIFVEDLKKAVIAAGFSVHHLDKADLVAFYRGQGIAMPDNYRHLMIQMCKPVNSGKSLPANPERSVFVQKFFSVYSRGAQTEIRFLIYSPRLIGDLLGHNEFSDGPSDDDFAQNMTNAFTAMAKIADSVV
jgi:hypothetical protein